MNLGDDFRQWHWLRPNKSTTLPGSIIFVDVHCRRTVCPTVQNTYMEALECGWAGHVRLEKGVPSRRHSLRFFTPEQLWGWVIDHLDSHRTTWLFAHHLSRMLTVTCFWQQMEGGRFDLQQAEGANADPKTGKGGNVKPWRGFVCLDDPPTIIKVRHRSKTLQLVDTLNYWKLDMDGLADVAGEQRRGHLPVDTSPEEAALHCCRGVNIIEKAVLTFTGIVRDTDLGNFAPTAPSQAWQAYRHRFMYQPILIHGSRSVIELERSAYYPGRWELFYCGKVSGVALPGIDARQPAADGGRPVINGPIYNLDCKSFYPSLMLNRPYPYKLVGYEVSPTVSQAIEITRLHAAVARVKISTNSVAFPVRVPDKIVYATGSFVTTLCGAELEKALHGGYVKWIGDMAYYLQAPILHGFATYTIQMRAHAVDRGEPHKAELWKLLGNSLFGKFGQRSPRWEDTEDYFPEKRWGQWVAHWPETQRTVALRSLNNLVQMRAKVDEAQHSFPLISAYVTAYGRCRMDHYRAVAGHRNVLYQHTDSLIVTQEGRDNLERANLITEGVDGTLIEKGKADYADFWAQNDYNFGGKRVCGSVALTAVERGPSDYVQEEYQRAERILQYAPFGQVAVRIVARHLERELPPGKCGADGFFAPAFLP